MLVGPIERERGWGVPFEPFNAKFYSAVECNLIWSIPETWILVCQQLFKLVPAFSKIWGPKGLVHRHNCGYRWDLSNLPVKLWFKNANASHNIIWEDQLVGERELLKLYNLISYEIMQCNLLIRAPSTLALNHKVKMRLKGRETSVHKHSCAGLRGVRYIPYNLIFWTQIMTWQFTGIGIPIRYFGAAAHC